MRNTLLSLLMHEWHPQGSLNISLDTTNQSEVDLLPLFTYSSVRHEKRSAQ